MLLMGVVALAGTRAETAPPVVRSFAGVVLDGDNHNYFIESELQLPLYDAAPWTVLYQHRETTPFLEIDGTDVQAEVLYQREELAVDFQLCRQASLRAVAGYRTVHAEDRASAIEAAKGALDGLVLEGVRTTIPFHRRVLDDPQFRSGRYDLDLVTAARAGR